MAMEIVPSLLAVGIGNAEAKAFADSVIDRFGNPFLEHRWESISLNYTAKMEMRNVETIKRYIACKANPPTYMALGFAAYLLLLRDVAVSDPLAPVIRHAWKQHDLAAVVDAVLGQHSIWKIDLRTLSDFAALVVQQLKNLLETGVQTTIKSALEK